MQSNHYFIGIHVPEDERKQLLKEQNILRKHVEYKNWTGADDFHITVKFLGAVGESELQKLIAACNELTMPEQLICELTSLDYFGKSDGPRVLIRRVRKEPTLLGLQSDFEAAAERCGYPPEKRDYTPHVTLAKKFISANGAVANILKQTETTAMRFIVDKVTLFRIEPQQTPRYVPVVEFRMKGGTDDGAAHQA